MTSPATLRPPVDESGTYYARYISEVPDGDVAARLVTQLGETLAVLTSLSDDDALYRYAKGKWSVKEIIGHLADSERIFAYRLLRIVRGDTTPLPGFDENAFVAGADFDRLPLAQLLHALRLVRENTVTLVHSLRPDDWTRRGTASDTPLSARALVWIIAGHELHHRTVLQERYLAAIGGRGTGNSGTVEQGNRGMGM